MNLLLLLVAGVVVTASWSAYRSEPWPRAVVLLSICAVVSLAFLSRRVV